MSQTPDQSQANLPHPVINRPYTAKDIPSCNFGPIGLLGFGMTTILLNIHNAGFYPITGMILAMGIFYGGISQIIAGILGSRKGNTFAATAFISYGFFWLTLVAIWILPDLGLSKGIVTPPGFMGWYLFLWGVMSFFMFIGTLKANRVLQIIFFLLFILFFLLAAHNWTGSELLGKIAGWEGILCGASAFYLAVAEVLNEQFGRDVLPI